MKLRLEASKEELTEKGAELLHAVAERLAPYSDDAVRLLEHMEHFSKALNSSTLADEEKYQLRAKVVRSIHDEMMRIYKKNTKAMLDEIQEVIAA